MKDTWDTYDTCGNSPSRILYQVIGTYFYKLDIINENPYNGGPEDYPNEPPEYDSIRSILARYTDKI